MRIYLILGMYIGVYPRDDDSPENYGGVSYIYNHEEIQVAAPLRYNQYSSGRAIYAGKNVDDLPLKQHVSRV